MDKTTTIAAGIDVSKAKLDVVVHGGKQCWQVANAPDGFCELVQLMRAHNVHRIGLEATGGYERDVAEHLRQAGFAIVVLQPIQLRAFAKLTLRLAKTDRIDAALIAAFTAQFAIERKPTDPRLAPLAEQLTCIEQIEEDMTRIKVRLEHVRETSLRRTWLADLARLKERRAHMLAKLVGAVRCHDDLATRFRLILSIDGIANRTALALLIRMPELGRLSRNEAAALGGLAPFAHDSGKRSGERHIRSGRTRLRTSLYAAALPAAFRWNSNLVAFYARLVAAGKAHKVALVACTRKLLIFANTVLARGTPWTKSVAAA